MKTGIYLRISKDWKGEALGVERQETECRELVERLGWTVTKVYTDNDLSASRADVVRPAYRDMLDDMQNGRIEAVVAWIVDRLVRQPAELEELIRIADANAIQFSTVRAGHIDLSTSSGRLVARILGAAAKHEVDLKSERQIAQRRQAAHQGRPNFGGIRPYGWQDDRVSVNEAEAKVIRAAADKILGGDSLNGVARWLYDQGVPSPSGREHWNLVTLRRILISPRTAGYATYKDEIVGRGQWEPILDEDTWRRIVARFESTNTKFSGRVGKRSLLGIDMIECGVCGYSLRINTKPDGRFYTCRDKFLPGRPGYKRSCGGIAITAEPLEEDVAERFMADVLRHAEHPLMRQAKTDRDDTRTSGVAADLAEREERLRQLGTDYADGLIGRPEFLSARARLAETIDELRHKLEQDSTNQVFPTWSAAALAEWWEAASLSERRAALKTRIDAVVVHPRERNGPGHDYSRVEVRWR